MLQDLNQLFAAPQAPSDETRCLDHIGEMLAEFGPSLLLLVGCNRQIVAVDQAGLITHAEEIGGVAGSLEEGLRTQRSCFFEYASRKGAKLAFGVRLASMTTGSVLGGLVMPKEGVRERLVALIPHLVTCGNLAWQVLDQRAAVKRITARKDQLQIEHQTLHSAHVKALDQALEEQQKRIDTERHYSHRLETEVELRSAELRQAWEDANNKAQELLEYSVALENANLAMEQFMQAAEDANRAKGQFLANTSHEIRTPITAMLGYADIILEGNIDQATREHAEVIRRNGEHLLGLINDILDLSKVEAGKMRIERSRCSPTAVVREAVSLMRVRAEEKHLNLEIEPFPCLPETVLTDPLRLRQVLVNLLSNAIKFTDHGEVRIAVRLLTDEVAPRLQFEVTDTGIGMSEEQIGELFQPFTQVDSSSARRFGGTGLGLAISKRLTEALGGKIQVSSAVAKGSTFRVTIDPGSLAGTRMVHQETGMHADSQPVSTSGAIHKTELPARVLLAEDGPDNQRLIDFFLQKAGAHVTIVENGQLALEQVVKAWEKGQPFEVVLMDMQMPVMDGYTAVRQLRERGHAVPIIALTANAMAEDRQNCLDAGCDDYLAKPIDRKLLLETVARFVNRQPQMREVEA